MKHIRAFKNIFKKKKEDEEPDYEVKGEDKSFKFEIGNYVKIKEEDLNDSNILLKDHIFKIIKKSDFGISAGKIYRRYYGLYDITTGERGASKYEEHLELVPEYEVDAKKYGI